MKKTMMMLGSMAFALTAATPAMAHMTHSQMAMAKKCKMMSHHAMMHNKSCMMMKKKGMTGSSMRSHDKMNSGDTGMMSQDNEMMKKN